MTYGSCIKSLDHFIVNTQLVVLDNFLLFPTGNCKYESDKNNGSREETSERLNKSEEPVLFFRVQGRKLTFIQKLPAGDR